MSRKSKSKRIKIETGGNPKTAIVASDFHFPHADPLCVNLFLKFTKRFEPDVVVLNGDIMDMYELSRFSKSPQRKHSLQDEFDLTRDFLTEVRQASPNARIIFQEGNHEDRLGRWMCDKSEVSSLRSLTLENQLGFSELEIEPMGYSEGQTQFADHMIHHGVSTAKKSAGHNNAQEWGMSGVSGHTHRISASPHRSHAADKIWYESGCMCSLKVSKEYIKTLPNWQHGFGILSSFRGKGYYEQIRIRDYAFAYCGEMFYYTGLKTKGMEYGQVNNTIVIP